MVIDLATKNDIEGILPLQSQIYRIEQLPENAAEILGELMAADNCDVIVAKENGKVLGSATVFYLKNPGHKQPYAFLEGIVVDDKKRGRGIGTAISQKVIELAKSRNCYKILFTSGMDRQQIHSFYQKLGFKKWGLEFRMDLP